MLVLNRPLCTNYIEFPSGIAIFPSGDALEPSFVGQAVRRSVGQSVGHWEHLLRTWTYQKRIIARKLSAMPFGKIAIPLGK